MNNLALQITLPIVGVIVLLVGGYFIYNRYWKNRNKDIKNTDIKHSRSNNNVSYQSIEREDKVEEVDENRSLSGNESNDSLPDGENSDDGIGEKTLTKEEEEQRILEEVFKRQQEIRMEAEKQCEIIKKQIEELKENHKKLKESNKKDFENIAEFNEKLDKNDKRLTALEAQATVVNNFADDCITNIKNRIESTENLDAQLKVRKEILADQNK